MAIKAKKPRSPMVGKVFERFIQNLRSNPEIPGVVPDRLESALSETNINASTLRDALFPKSKNGKQ